MWAGVGPQRKRKCGRKRGEKIKPNKQRPLGAWHLLAAVKLLVRLVQLHPVSSLLAFVRLDSQPLLLPGVELLLPPMVLLGWRAQGGGLSKGTPRLFAPQPLLPYTSCMTCSHGSARL